MSECLSPFCFDWDPLFVCLFNVHWRMTPHMKVPQGIVSFAQAMIAVKKATVRQFLHSSKLVILLRKILFLSFLFSRVLVFSREFYSLRGAKSRGVKKPFYSLKLALRKRFQLFPHWKEAHHIRPLSFSFMPKFFLLQKILILIKIHSLNNYCYFPHCMKSQINAEQLENLFMNDLKSSLCHAL